MSMLQEFKEFAVKGNVMDLAVGVIIGGAFGKITTSLVDDVIMPVISAAIGDVDFSNMLIPLAEVPEGTAMTYAALKEAGVPVLAYGNFITILINFIILAFIVFLLVKGMNKMRRQAEAEPEAPAEPSEEVLLLREISQKLSK
ncbi:large conductance mechanosensitive channel protein MscL [Moraxella sp. K127]|uniref:large conductance mechanosensitive channel protein MscL n=1 Tax=Moraxella TaxID=475 RepID=UPI0018803700|nr:large conductance mechanosensitive channel protein MscL [Moraxella sp. K127]MBE9590347.1 large conductance mechanosensitive channel protein MscL [Moraxella sp. K127]